MLRLFHVVDVDCVARKRWTICPTRQRGGPRDECFCVFVGDFDAVVADEGREALWGVFCSERCLPPRFSTVLLIHQKRFHPQTTLPTRSRGEENSTTSVSKPISSRPFAASMASALDVNQFAPGSGPTW